MPSSACKKCALRSEEHTSELQSHDNLVCRLLLEKITYPARLSSLPPALLPPLPHIPTRAMVERRTVRELGDGGLEGRRGLMLLFFFFLKFRGPPQSPPFPPPPLFQF